MDYESIQKFILEYGYFAIAAGTVIDASGLQLFIIAAGVLAGMEEEFFLSGVIIAGSIGNLLSDHFFYALGRWRANWLERLFRTKHPSKKEKFERTKELVQRYAWAFFIFGRFVPWVGRFIPALAGLQKLSSGRFFLLSLAGSLIAASGFAALGYFGGEAIRKLEGWSVYLALGGFLLSLLVISLSLKKIGRWLEKKAKK